MKILIIGSALEGALEKHYLKYLNELGVETVIYDIHGQFIRQYQKSYLLKVLLHLRFLFFYWPYNTKLKKYILNFTPSHIIVFKGMEIFPRLLKWLSTQDIKLFNYNPDNPFIFSGIGSGNKNISDSIPLYDAYFTYDSAIFNKLKQKYAKPTYLLPFGYEVEDHVVEKCKILKEINKVCFLGNPDKYRASFISLLASKGLPVDVFGAGWSNWINLKNVKCHDSVYGDRFWETLYQYRVQLNLMRPHNLYSHNMRSFEVPGIGGIMLAPNTPDHRKYFDENKEIFLFEGIDNCYEKAIYILNMSKHEIKKIRDNARQKSLHSGYSYKYRAKYMFECLSTL